jgi:nickel/cobalt transporter (NicO) family protein
MMGRRSLRILRGSLLAVALAAVPGAVLAHPIGNFTINHYAGITISPTGISLDVVIDMAEIPAFQERLRIDEDGDGEVSDEESTQAAATECVTLASTIRLTVDGAVLVPAPGQAGLSFPSGAGGLSTMRLECRLEADVALQPARRTTIAFEDRSYPDRIGWREIVAFGDGVAVTSDALPASSPSKRLTTYPADLVSQPLDIRSATVVAVAGPSGASLAPAAPVVPATGAGTTTGAVPGGIGGELPAIFRTVDLTPIVLLLSIGTAIALGAGHALTPGHGKTLMAAYLVGSRGTPLHAVGLGLAVTVSHTLGILVLAGLVIAAQGALPPDVVIRVAPAAAAVMFAVIGGWMLVGELRRRLVGHRSARGNATGHGHEHEHADAHDHPNDHPEVHSHGGVQHSHLPEAGGTLTWRGLFALGLAGGLIPSTSALFILLGSIVAGRPLFGLVLVVVFGLGMAVVMTAVGLAMVFARGRLDRMPARSPIGRLAPHAQLVAAVVVLGFGLYLTIQAVAGPPPL